MQSKKLKNVNSAASMPRVTASTHVVTADSVQAEEVPTIPLDSLKTINTLQPEVSIHSVASTRAVSMPVPLVVQPSEYRRSLGEWVQVWWDGVRPTYLPLSLMPILAGSAVAWMQTVSVRTPFGYFHLTHFIFTIIAVTALQVGAHLINDYYDYLRGIDTSNTLGPGGLIQQGLIKPSRILTLGLALLGMSAVLGVFVALAGGPLAYLLGLVGLLCAYFYSATSRALSSLSLGELVSFCVFGPLLTLGAYMVQTGHADRSVLIYSLPLGLLAAAVIHVNNMRDVEGDAHAGKRTIASLIGLQWSRVLFIMLMLGAYAVLVALSIPRGAPHLVLITLWTLPIFVVAISGVLRTDVPAGLHLVMRQTLALETYLTLLLVVALVISAFLPILPHLPAHLLPV